MSGAGGGEAGAVGPALGRAGDPAVDRARLVEAYALPDRAAPRIRMNFVMSLDGAATVDGRSGGLGDAADRLAMDVLRSLADVVVVGAGTVRVEGYGGLGLSPEGIAWRRAQGLAEEPRLALVSASLELDPGLPVFTQAVQRPIIVTGASSDAGKRAALAEVAEVLVCGERGVDPITARDALAARGLSQQLCEGGPRLFASLIEADAVDELCLSLSPLLVSGGAGRITAGGHEHTRRMHLVHALPAGDLLLLRYARAR